MHLALAGMQAGKLRDKLFGEKDLTIDRMVELTALYEEADVKKSQEGQKAKKALTDKSQTSGPSKGTGDLRCYNCEEIGYRRIECPTLPRCTHCGKAFHVEKDCRSKMRGEPKVAPTQPQAKKARTDKKPEDKKKKLNLSGKGKKFRKKKKEKGKAKK